MLKIENHEDSSPEVGQWEPWHRQNLQHRNGEWVHMMESMIEQCLALKGKKKGGNTPSSKIAWFTNGHTAQVSAHAEHDEPLRLLDVGIIGLWITKALASSDEVWMEAGVCTVGRWKERA
jgi:hypothetical protein